MKINEFEQYLEGKTVLDLRTIRNLVVREFDREIKWFDMLREKKIPISKEQFKIYDKQMSEMQIKVSMIDNKIWEMGGEL